MTKSLLILVHEVWLNQTVVILILPIFIRLLHLCLTFFESLQK